MTKPTKELAFLIKRFPRLAKDIIRSAEAIEDTYKIIRKSTVESYKRDRRTISTLAQSGALPSAVAKFLIGQLVDPEESQKSFVFKRIITTLPGVFKGEGAFEHELGTATTPEQLMDVISHLEADDARYFIDKIGSNGPEDIEKWLEDAGHKTIAVGVHTIKEKLGTSFDYVQAKNSLIDVIGLGISEEKLFAEIRVQPVAPAAAAPLEDWCDLCKRRVKDIAAHQKEMHAEPEEVRIRGKVQDVQTKGPIPDAQIRAGVETRLYTHAKSDKDGNYELSIRLYLPAKIDVAANATGYEPDSHEIKIATGETSKTVNFKLKRTRGAGWKAWKAVDPFGTAVSDGRDKIRAEAEQYARDRAGTHEKDREELTKAIERHIAGLELAEKDYNAEKRKDKPSTAALTRLDARIRELQAAIKAETKAQEDLLDYASEKFPDELKAHLKAYAATIVGELTAKYDISGRATDLGRILEIEADSEGGVWGRFLVTGKTGTRALKHRGAAVAGMNVADYARTALVRGWGIWAFIIGFALFPPAGIVLGMLWLGSLLPPVLTAVILLAQFAFLFGGTFLGVVPLPGYVAFGWYWSVAAALFGAVLNFWFNARKQPGFIATVSHAASGAVIAFTAIMLVVSLQAFGAGGLVFTAITIVLIAIGVFQIYGQAGYPGGAHSINMLALGIMVFAYFALGPYSAMVVGTVDQTISPLKMAFAAASTATSDVWLLVTNPTEYYAQQNLRAARSERPMDYPKGVEITSLQAFPAGTVPAGEEFVVYMVIENQATEAVSEIGVKAACEKIGGMDEACTPTSDSNMHIDIMHSGQAESLTFSFKSVGKTGQRSAETSLNKVTFSVSYTLNTSSNLKVELATQDEMARRMLAKESKFYYPEIATAKVGPAQVGMTVGPQPLVPEKSGTAKMLVSIINSRPDGNVSISPNESELGISSSNLIAVKGCRSTALECVPREVQNRIIGVICTAKGVQYSEPSKPISALCSLELGQIAETRPSQTELLTAELVNYRFTMQKEVRVAVGAPREILVPKELVPG